MNVQGDPKKEIRTEYIALSLPHFFAL